MVVPLRSQARLWHSLLHWAYFGLFRAQRAAFVRPAVGGPVFRRCAPPSPSAARCSGAADALWACPRASSRFAASNGQRPGRECIFTANASICSAKNARNDVHAVISDLSLVLPMLCQCSVAGSKILSLPFYLAIFVFKMRCEAIRMITIDNVTKIYTKGKKHITALKDINLSIPTGSVVGFLGSNGAGKIRRHQAL